MNSQLDCKKVGIIKVFLTNTH